MLRNLAAHAAAHGARRIPGLRWLPVFKLLAIAQIALLARRHIARLDAVERRRLVELVIRGRAWPPRLAPVDRDELRTLVAKAEPRLFAGLVADRLSPVPLPRRLVHGRRPPRG